MAQYDQHLRWATDHFRLHKELDRQWRGSGTVFSPHSSGPDWFNRPIMVNITGNIATSSGTYLYNQKDPNSSIPVHGDYFYMSPEPTMIVPSAVSFAVNAEPFNGDAPISFVDIDLSWNGVYLGTIGPWSVNAEPPQATHSGTFVLNDFQQQTVLRSRVEGNQGIISLRLYERTSTNSTGKALDDFRIYAAKLWVHGDKTYTNSTTVPTNNVVKVYPTSFRFFGHTFGFNDEFTWTDWYNPKDPLEPSAPSPLTGTEVNLFNQPPTGVNVDVDYIRKRRTDLDNRWGLQEIDGQTLQSELRHSHTALVMKFAPPSGNERDPVSEAKLQLRLGIPIELAQHNVASTGASNYINHFDIHCWHNSWYNPGTPQQSGAWVLYGAGNILTASGFKNFEVDLGFLNTAISKGNRSVSPNTKILKTFQDLEVYLVGLEFPAQLSGTELQIWKGELESSSIPLYINGNINNNITLYTYGMQTSNSNTTLFLENFEGASGDISLYTLSTETANSGITLWTSGIPSHQTTLYIAGVVLPKSTSNIPCYMAASAPEECYILPPTEQALLGEDILQHCGFGADLRAGTILYTHGTPPITDPGVLQLVLKGPQSPLQTDQFPLYILSALSGINNFHTLYINNSGITNPNLELYLEGPAGTGINSNFPLFIGRDSEALTRQMPLFIHVPSDTNENTTLFTKGGFLNESITIVVSGSQIVSKNPPLFTHGF